MKEQIVNQMKAAIRIAIEEEHVYGWRALMFVALHKVVACSKDAIIRDLSVTTAMSFAYLAEEELLREEGGEYYYDAFYKH